MRVMRFAAGILSVACLMTIGESPSRHAAFAGPELQPQAAPSASPLPRSNRRKPAVEQLAAAPREAIAKADEEPMLPYTPRWWAREQAIEDRLKKSIMICRGC